MFYVFFFAFEEPMWQTLSIFHVFVGEQCIWTEIGESDEDQDSMLLEIERECMNVYRRKVDEASNAKAQLHRTVAAKEAELAALMASLGDHTLYSQV